MRRRSAGTSLAPQDRWLTRFREKEAVMMKRRREVRTIRMLGVLALAFALSLIESRALLADSLSEMISPVSLPTINEDPRIDSEIRPMFMYTDISNDFVTNGGHRYEGRLHLPSTEQRRRRRRRLRQPRVRLQGGIAARRGVRLDRVGGVSLRGSVREPGRAPGKRRRFTEPVRQCREAIRRSLARRVHRPAAGDLGP
jgi:hypothetical protein